MFVGLGTPIVQKIVKHFQSLDVSVALSAMVAQAIDIGVNLVINTASF